MYLTKEAKKKVISKHGKTDKNTGNTEAQVALFTERINHLTEHMKGNKNDKGTQKALIDMVGQRKSLLDYLKKKDIMKYRKLIEDLNIRK
ncbi:MAG: 30S ribosomal protein S15 [Bacteroidota bacterium]